jgi:hypothetical protein
MMHSDEISGFSGTVLLQRCGDYVERNETISDLRSADGMTD